MAPQPRSRPRIQAARHVGSQRGLPARWEKRGRGSGGWGEKLLSSPAFFSLKSQQSCLLSQETFADPAAPQSPPSAPSSPSDTKLACAHHGSASPEANSRSYQMLSHYKIQSWGKAEAQPRPAAKVFPYPHILPAPPERAGTKLYFFG